MIHPNLCWRVRLYIEVQKPVVHSIYFIFEIALFFQSQFLLKQAQRWKSIFCQADVLLTLAAGPRRRRISKLAGSVFIFLRLLSFQHTFLCYYFMCIFAHGVKKNWRSRCSPPIGATDPDILYLACVFVNTNFRPDSWLGEGNESPGSTHVHVTSAAAGRPGCSAARYEMNAYGVASHCIAFISFISHSLATRYAVIRVRSRECAALASLELHHRIALTSSSN